MSYVSIRARGAPREAKAEEIERAYQEARGSAEDLRTWAARSGLKIKRAVGP